MSEFTRFGKNAHGPASVGGQFFDWFESAVNSRSRQKGIAQEQREEGLQIAPATNQQSREGIAQKQERVEKIDTGMGISL